MKRMFGLVLMGTLLAMTLAGCFIDRSEARKKSDDGVEPKAGPAVAVVPFKGLAQAPDSGQLVAAVMVAEMRALRGYQVIVPDGAGDGEQTGWEIDAEGVDDAPYVLTGRVTSFSGKSGGGEHPVVGVAAQLVERETGKVVWSGTRTRKGSAAWFQEDSLDVLTSRVCNDLAKSLYGHIGKNGLPATLADKGEPPRAKPMDDGGPALADASKPSRAKKAAARKNGTVRTGPTPIKVKSPDSGESAPAAAAGKKEPAKRVAAKRPTISANRTVAPEPAQPVDASGLAAAIIGRGSEPETLPVPSSSPPRDAGGNAAAASPRRPGNLKNGTRIVSKPVYPNSTRPPSASGRREPDQVMRLTIPSQPQASAAEPQYEEPLHPMYQQRLTGDMM